MNKSEYRKQQETKKVLTVYILIALFGISFGFLREKCNKTALNQII